MVNSRATGKLVLLHKHTSVGTEASHIYTPSPVITATKFTKIIIQIEGEATAALDPQMILNSDENAIYYVDGSRTDGATLALKTASAANNIDFGAVSGVFVMEVTIEGLNQPQPMGHYNIMHGAQIQESGNWMINLDVAETISEIEIQTSTSTWKAGARIYIYGVQA